MAEVYLAYKDLESALEPYKDVFQVGNKKLSTIIASVQPVLTSSIKRMIDYRTAVVEAVAEIKRREAADRAAAQAEQEAADRAAAAAQAEQEAQQTRAITMSNY